MIKYKVKKHTWVWCYKNMADDDTLRNSFDLRIHTKRTIIYRSEDFVRTVCTPSGVERCYLFHLPPNDKNMKFVMIPMENVERYV